MNHIWIVEGSTGEYSDHNEWAVCAFEDEQKAKDLAEKLSALSREIEQYLINKGEPYYDWDDKENECQATKDILALDDCFKLDYTGTSYMAYEVELRG